MTIVLGFFLGTLIFSVLLILSILTCGLGLAILVIGIMEIWDFLSNLFKRWKGKRHG